MKTGQADDVTIDWQQQQQQRSVSPPPVPCTRGEVLSSPDLLRVLLPLAAGGSPALPPLPSAMRHSGKRSSSCFSGATAGAGVVALPWPLPDAATLRALSLTCRAWRDALRSAPLTVRYLSPRGPPERDPSTEAARQWEQLRALLLQIPTQGRHSGGSSGSAGSSGNDGLDVAEAAPAAGGQQQHASLPLLHEVCVDIRHHSRVEAQEVLDLLGHRGCSRMTRLAVSGDMLQSGVLQRMAADGGLPSLRSLLVALSCRQLLALPPEAYDILLPPSLPFSSSSNPFSSPSTSSASGRAVQGLDRPCSDSGPTGYGDSGSGCGRYGNGSGGYDDRDIEIMTGGGGEDELEHLEDVVWPGGWDGLALQLLLDREESSRPLPDAAYQALSLAPNLRCLALASSFLPSGASSRTQFAACPQTLLAACPGLWALHLETLHWRCSGGGLDQLAASLAGSGLRLLTTEGHPMGGLDSPRFAVLPAGGGAVGPGRGMAALIQSLCRTQCDSFRVVCRMVGPGQHAWGAAVRGMSEGRRMRMSLVRRRRPCAQQLQELVLSAAAEPFDNSAVLQLDTDLTLQVLHNAELQALVGPLLPCRLELGAPLSDTELRLLKVAPLKLHVAGCKFCETEPRGRQVLKSRTWAAHGVRLCEVSHVAQLQASDVWLADHYPRLTHVTLSGDIRPRLLPRSVQHAVLSHSIRSQRSADLAPTSGLAGGEGLFPGLRRLSLTHFEVGELPSRLERLDLVTCNTDRAQLLPGCKFRHVTLSRCNGFRTALDLGQWLLDTSAEVLEVVDTAWTADPQLLRQLPGSRLCRLFVQSTTSSSPDAAHARARVIAEMFAEQLGEHFRVRGWCDGRVATCEVLRRDVDD